METGERGSERNPGRERETQGERNKAQLDEKTSAYGYPLFLSWLSCRNINEKKM